MSWQKCMSFSKCSNLEAKNVDISPEPVDGFLKFKQRLEAEKILDSFYTTDF